jgi:Cytochrome P460
VPPAKRIDMKQRSKNLLLILTFAAASVGCIIAAMSITYGHDDEASPIFGVKVPAGYRQWGMVAVAQEAGVDELRGVLGNALAIDAYRNGILPFPDGAILVKLAWKRIPLAGLDGAFVTGAPTTVQIMVKDSKKYASTGGWGFGRFIDGISVDKAQHETCFPCHEANVPGHDFVFTRFAP